MNTSNILLILGAIILVALGIAIGIWKTKRASKKDKRARGDAVVREVESGVRQGLVENGVDEETQEQILKSEETKKEIDAISKEPDQKRKLQRLADLTNRLTKGK